MKIIALLCVLVGICVKATVATAAVLTAPNVLVCPITVPPWPTNRMICSKTPIFVPLPNTVNAAASGSKSAPFFNHTFDGYLASDLIVACPIGATASASACTYSGKDASALVAKASVPTFSIAVPPPPPIGNTFTLTWTAPTKNTDGSALTNLVGYNIYQGTSTTGLTQVASISASSPTYTTSVLPSTATGYYFSVTAVNSAGVESVQSSPVSSVITTPSSPTNLKVIANPSKAAST